MKKHRIMNGVPLDELDPPLIQPRRSRKQKETQDQKIYVKALNASGLGYFWRVKTMGTYDPIRKTFRRNSDIRGLSDISGYRFNGGRAVFIEVKWVRDVDKKRNLIFKTTLTPEQKEHLLRAYDAGCIAGVAFTLEDAVAIAHDDPERYPRHPRTFMFLPEVRLNEYVEKYKILKKAFTEKNQDPLWRYGITG